MADAAPDWQPTADAVHEAMALVADALGLPNLTALKMRHYHAGAGAALCGAQLPAHTLWLEPLIVGSEVRFSQSVECGDCIARARAISEAAHDIRTAGETRIRTALFSLIEKLKK